MYVASDVYTYLIRHWNLDHFTPIKPAEKKKFKICVLQDPNM